MRFFIYLFSLLYAICSLHGSLEALSAEDVAIIPYKENRTDKRKAKVSISCIFQDEADYLREWIEYHRLIGVSHFYLYNNRSRDDYLKVLRPYIEKGIVELFDVPFDSTLFSDGAATHNFVQVCCYNHSLKKSKYYTRWLAVIDSDEFIALSKYKSLPKFLKNFHLASGIVVYWQLYGTSGVLDLLPGELLIEKLLYKTPQNYEENFQFKSIVRPKEVLYFYDPHFCRYKDNLLALTPNLKVFHHGFRPDPIPVDQIRINHYTFRTEKFYHLVKKPRRAQWGYLPSPEAEQERLNLFNSSYDPIMLRFVKKLKKNLR